MYSKVEKLITVLPLSVVTRIEHRVLLLSNRRVLSIVLNLEFYAIQCSTGGYTMVDDLGNYYEYSEPCQELIDILNGKKVPNNEGNDEETEAGN